MGDTTIAQTIIAQIKANDLWTLARLGANHFVSDGNKLTFKVNMQGFKWVRITLEANDTYRVEAIAEKRKKDEQLSRMIGKTRYNMFPETVRECDQVYHDVLNQVIERFAEELGKC